EGQARPRHAVARRPQLASLAGQTTTWPAREVGPDSQMAGPGGRPRQPNGRPGRSAQTARIEPVAVKLRLMRMGKKKQPTYRIVAADSSSPRDGRFIEIVGTYAPRSEPSVVKIDSAKAVNWLSQGAKPTERVEKLLRVSGTWDEFTASASK